MNYRIPGAQSDLALFTANSTLVLGTYDKPVDARSILSIEYGALTPAVTLVGYSFRVKPGGEPQLAITDSAIDLTSTALDFTVSGGISGRTYEVIVNATLASGEVRSDLLTVNVLGDDSCGCMVMPRLPLVTGSVSGDGGVFINDLPRFFVSGTDPINPNILDRWYDTTTGAIYDYVTNGVASYWDLSSVGGGGGDGGGGGSGANIQKIDPISPNGVTTTFALTVSGNAVNITGSNYLFVSVDGVWQQPVASYSATSNQISFVRPPDANSVVFMLWFAPPS